MLLSKVEATCSPGPHFAQMDRCTFAPVFVSVRVRFRSAGRPQNRQTPIT